MHRSTRQSQEGFSLIEMLIVLVVIGLFLGILLFSADLYRSYEIRSVTSQMNELQSAINTFKDKYNAIPGDFGKAGEYWGVNPSGTCPDDAYGGTGTQTCSGDGDGFVEWGTNASRTSEAFTFWQHLSNGKLISGTYSGIAGSGGQYDAVLGTNTPSANINGTGFTSYHVDQFHATIGVDPSRYSRTYGHVLEYGKKELPSASVSWPVFTPSEMYKLDVKEDDGLPGLGKITSQKWDDDCTNATSATDFESKYDTSSQDLECNFWLNNVY